MACRKVTVGMGVKQSFQFHLLSFEGPDRYSQAGGLASRVTGLADGLAAQGFDTHLWFVGDPDLPGVERRENLVLHRWCQWISGYHPRGVYEGEDGKAQDYAASIPPYLGNALQSYLTDPAARAVVMAEEWHTVHAVLHLDWLLKRSGLRDRVEIFWNANNVFGFDRIDWVRLADAATITTVSRYMRYRMWELGVDPIVIPNGLPPAAFEPADHEALTSLQERTRDRGVLVKMARWDPDKRWKLAIETVHALKERGYRPLLIARGGVEAHGDEVLRYAAGLGLCVSERVLRDSSCPDLDAVFTDTAAADIVHLRSSLCNARRRVLFEGAAAVLANSGHEPFGLVGLETMAAGGVACTGGTGEDYVVPGWNALVSQTTDAREFVDQFLRLQTRPAEERALRRRGRSTARIYEWSEVIKRSLLPRLQRPMQRVGVRQRVPRPVYPRPDTLSPRLVSTER